MKQKLKLLLLLFCLTFINCESKLNKGLVEAQLKDLQELGTSEYTLNKIIIAEDNQWYTIGDRKAVITMTASLKSGIDFSDIKIIDMNTEEKSITLQLPSSKIILLDINPDDIKYDFIKISSTRSKFSNKELNDIQILGEKSVREKIKDLGILEDADKNAKLFLTNWLNSMGLNQIKFI
ncbi:DUF4230 domain-containing protein [uncultured Winogradskyella sp.]|uniref:DUF4230 domain-containing protein n=1 Tax=uncultured Winogradskyella sp. TaxID=395353 RepID=UPI0030DBD0FB|tara:strand:- start:57567 stop:58103 length:537 start_codon:yes stop_codon:yes gene_type:complete